MKNWEKKSMKKLNDPLSWIGENKNKFMDSISLIGFESIITEEQVRKDFNEERLNELAESIKAHGVIEPLIVRETKELNKYILIAGERRFRAAKIAGLENVPCIIKYDIKDEDIIILQLIENGQREDLNPLELNAVYKKLQDSGLSIRDIAEKIGKSKSHVQEVLSISKLNDDEKLSAGRTLKKAVELSKIKDKSKRNELIGKDNISTKEIKKARTEGEKPKDKKQKEENVSYYKTLVDYQNDVITYDQAEEILLGFGMPMEQVKKYLKTSDEIKAIQKRTSIEEIIEAYKLGAYTYEEAEKLLTDESGSIKETRYLLAAYNEKEINQQQEQNDIKIGEELNTKAQEPNDNNQGVPLEDKIKQFNTLHNNIVLELGKTKDIKSHSLPAMQAGEATVIKIAFKSQNLVNDLINILNKSFPVK
ncbi:MAG: ParB/RepB/Spo0J family partition protein [bacterium]